MKRTLSALLLLIICLTGPAAFGANHLPLADFEPFIGGWQLDNSFQELEWGVGRRAGRSRGYFLVDGERKLVSEGSWVWHPGSGEIRGTFSAIDMPVALFEYTTRFEGKTMISDLKTYDTEGNASTFVETWELTAPDRYEWTLFSDSPEGRQKVMGDTYQRAQ